MKKIITICAVILMAASVFAQAPQKMSYQAVIRDGANALVANQTVGMQVSILQGSASGTAVYVETHNVITNINGLVSIEIGGGTVTVGSFAAIDWANGPYFIKTETDPAGGTNYTITGTTQLLSVPYALYAENGRSSVSNNGDTLFIGNQFYIIPGISGTNQSIGVSPLLMQHSCGAINVHNPNLNYGTMNDQDGNTYKTIIIGSQEWMAENLKTSHYRNGDLITTNLTDSMWGDAVIGACCFFNNDSANYCCPYGKLYNWFAVSDTRNVCPVGWHIPDIYEGNQLIKYLDIYADTSDGGSVLSPSVGGKLKNAGINYWMSPNTGANNASGFSALPGGYRRTVSGDYGNLGYFGYYWTSTTVSQFPYYIQVNSNDGSSGISRGGINHSNGLSLRCIKD